MSSDMGCQQRWLLRWLRWRYRDGAGTIASRRWLSLDLTPYFVMKPASNMRRQCIYASILSVEPDGIRPQHIHRRCYGGAASSHWKCSEKPDFCSVCDRRRHTPTASFPSRWETGSCCTRMASWKRRMPPESHLVMRHLAPSSRKGKNLEQSNSSISC